MSNRIAIFIFYDPQGIVDDYVPYFLERLKPFLKNLIIVVNGELTAEGRKKLKSFTQNIFVRENIGYEPGAIKDVLFKFYGMSKILEHDELLICNDTFYGPFFEFKELFNKMDKTKCDFWGITEQAEKKNHYPKHIQSYFYNIKKSLLHNEYFRNFFETLPLSKNLEQVIEKYEIAMSQTFLKSGFSYASFVDIKDFFNEDANKNFDYSLFAPIKLLKKKCPLIKRKAFFIISELEGGEQDYSLMQFIKEHTRYPQEIILQNVPRSYLALIIRERMKREKLNRKIILFTRAYPKIYIYGTGVWGKKVANILEYFKIDYKGFIVSCKDKNKLLKHKIYEFNEIKINKNTGIILGLGEKNTLEVLQILKKRNVNMSNVLKNIGS